MTNLLIRDPFLAAPFRLMDELLRSTGNGNRVTGFTPPVDVHETEDEYLVEIDLPGVKSEDVNVEVNDNVLSISGSRVADETGKELGSGQTGELVARGANIMRGYWNNPAETALAFRGGMFRTGDVGYQDGDGYFYILDRLKDMIVTGGENVYSGEVEAVIYEHPAVREAAVFGIPDPKWGELVMACVVLKPGQTLSVDELLAHCRQSLASYKVPRRVEFSESELPKNGSGKILKRVLRERFWEHQERAVS